MLLEFRAGCLWLQYWLAADAARPGGGGDGARRTSRTGRTSGAPAGSRWAEIARGGRAWRRRSAHEATNAAHCFGM